MNLSKKNIKSLDVSRELWEVIMDKLFVTYNNEGLIVAIKE